MKVYEMIKWYLNLVEHDSYDIRWKYPTNNLLSSGFTL